MERICDRTGEITVALETFEHQRTHDEDWFDFVPGSIYLTRLLRELQAGASTGIARSPAAYAAPDGSEALQAIGLRLAADIRRDQTPETWTREAAVAAFHFQILLRGLQFVERLLTIVVDPDSLSTLQPAASSEWEALEQGQPGLGAKQIKACYVTAAKQLSGKLEHEIQRFAQACAPEVARIVRAIRRIAKQDTEALDNSSSWASAPPQALDAIRTRIQEEAEAAERGIRRRSRVNHVDVRLVGATVEWRQFVAYRQRLRLPGNRTRDLNWFYDCSAGSPQEIRCEGCSRPTKKLNPSANHCTHLLCDSCLNQSARCGHTICPACRHRCETCQRPVCQSCSPKPWNCKHIFCKRHRSKCAECRKVVCGLCERKCAQCKKIICSEHLDDSSDAAVHCRRHRVLCIDCGEEILDVDEVETCLRCKKPICVAHQGRFNCDHSFCARHTLACVDCRRPACPECADTCDVCEKPLCSEHFDMFDCDHLLCARHRGHCAVCSELICPECNPSCRQCGRPLCEEHGFFSDCGHGYCPSHRKRCPICGEDACRTCTEPCDKCKRVHCVSHTESCPTCEATVCSRHLRHSKSCYSRWIESRLALLRYEIACLSRAEEEGIDRVSEEQLTTSELPLLLSTHSSQKLSKAEIDYVLETWFHPIPVYIKDQARLRRELSRIDEEIIQRARRIPLRY